MAKYKSEVKEQWQDMKQQIKRYKNDNKKRELNNSYKSALKTAIKKVKTAVEAGDKEAAVAAYNVAASKLDASSK